MVASRDELNPNQWPIDYFVRLHVRERESQPAMTPVTTRNEFFASSVMTYSGVVRAPETPENTGQSGSGLVGNPLRCFKNIV